MKRASGSRVRGGADTGGRGPPLSTCDVWLPASGSESVAIVDPETEPPFSLYDLVIRFWSFVESARRIVTTREQESFAPGAAASGRPWCSYALPPGLLAFQARGAFGCEIDAAMRLAPWLAASPVNRVTLSFGRRHVLGEWKWPMSLSICTGFGSRGYARKRFGDGLCACYVPWPKRASLDPRCTLQSDAKELTVSAVIFTHYRKRAVIGMSYDVH